MILGITYPKIQNLDYDSVVKICNNSQQAMIYGFGHCGYGALCAILSGPQSPLKQMFDCSVGNPDAPFYTLEGRKIQQLDAHISDLEDSAENNIKICDRMCKFGITNIVLENYKRKQENLPLIPVIFAIDADHVTFDPTRYASTTPELNQLLTHKELRRCYKLCCTIDHARLKQAAKDTFVFTKLINQGNGDYRLDVIPPFWERSKVWDLAWQQRQNEQSIKNVKSLWKKELKNAAEEYEAKYQQNC